MEFDLDKALEEVPIHIEDPPFPSARQEKRSSGFISELPSEEGKKLEHFTKLRPKRSKKQQPTQAAVGGRRGPPSPRPFLPGERAVGAGPGAARTLAGRAAGRSSTARPLGAPQFWERRCCKVSSASEQRCPWKEPLETPRSRGCDKSATCVEFSTCECDTMENKHQSICW